ncbi:MAG: hypothetical protein J7498_05475 [Sphingobium sp.]|nr:hypothetical protein [Sphingobium sp.]
MATGNARRFQELGVPSGTAKELAAQITASTGNVRRLGEMGFTPNASNIIAASVAAHTVNVRALCEAGVSSRVVAEFKTQIAS